MDSNHVGIDRGVAGRSSCATPISAQNEKGRVPDRVLAQRRVERRGAGLADCSVVPPNRLNDMAVNEASPAAVALGVQFW